MAAVLTAVGAGLLPPAIALAAQKPAPKPKAEAGAEIDGDDLPEKRPSEIEGVVISGTGSYLSLEMAAVVGLNADWALTGEVVTSSAADADPSTGVKLGASCLLPVPVELKASLIGRSEPDGIGAVGMSAGARWEVSALWGGRARTVLGLDLEGLSYGVPTTVSLKKSSVSSTSRFAQLGATFRLRQDLIARKLTANVSYSAYGYGSRATELTRLTGRRVVPLGGASSTLAGFPGSSLVVGAFYQVTPSLDLGASYTRSVPADSTIPTSGVGLEGGLVLSDHWTAIAEFSFMETTQAGLGFVYGW